MSEKLHEIVLKKTNSDSTGWGCYLSESDAKLAMELGWIGPAAEYFKPAAASGLDYDMDMHDLRQGHSLKSVFRRFKSATDKLPHEQAAEDEWRFGKDE